MVGRSSGKLQVTLPSDTEILMTRVFDAPRHILFEALTKPEHVRRWWCCMDGFRMTVCEIDLRVGGRYRYAIVGPDERELAFNGEYREIVAPERIVHTEVFELFPQAGTIVTMTLEERDGKTLYRSHILHQTKEARDGQVQAGMELGANLALDRVEDVVRALLARSGTAEVHGASVAVHDDR